MAKRPSTQAQESAAHETLDTHSSPAKLVKELDTLVETLGLLDRYKVITDTVWEEVWITELEAHVMDTVEFQRLHWVLQLGTAIFVYPDASHTRFEHSVGTLEAAERIIFFCNENSSGYGTSKISPYARVLGRLSALIHDLAQMPYAHTLDSGGEGHLFKTEWKDDSLRNRLLGKGGFVEKRLSEFFRGKHPQLVEHLRSDLEWIFIPSDDNKAQPSKERPYLSCISDIVGNTLCADLIDYVQRDLFSVGFRDRVALRALRFFVIRKVEGVEHLVLALWKPKTHDKMRHDVISESIEFLRKRYSLAERVYFHHAKIAASAMIIKAVELSGLKCQEIWYHGDYSLLKHLETSKQGENADTPAAVLIRSLLRRDVFKPAYELRHREEAEPGDPVKKVKDTYSKGNDARANLRWLEENLAICLGVPNEDVVAYCPDPDMNLKEFKALVWPKQGEEPIPLEKLPQAQQESEELKEKHRGLWALTIFVRKDLSAKPEVHARIERFCRALLEVPEPDTQTLSEIYVDSHEPEFNPESRPWLDRTQALQLVKGILEGKPRGEFRFQFPRVADVIATMKRA